MKNSEASFAFVQNYGVKLISCNGDIFKCNSMKRKLCISLCMTRSKEMCDKIHIHAPFEMMHTNIFVTIVIR